MGDGRVETPLHYQGERRVVTGTVKKKATKKKTIIVFIFFAFSAKPLFFCCIKFENLQWKTNTFSRQRLQIKIKLRSEIWHFLHAGPILHNVHCPVYNKHTRQWGCTPHCSVECARWSCQGRPLVGSSGARTESGLVSALHVCGRLGRKWEGSQGGKPVFFGVFFFFSRRRCGLENEYSAVV